MGTSESLLDRGERIGVASVCEEREREREGKRERERERERERDSSSGIGGVMGWKGG